MTTAAYQPRGDELAAWDRLSTGARAGRGGLLAIAGPAGFGKTTLLDLLGSRAAGAGLRPLRASGRLLHRNAAHSATRQLLESVDLAAVPDAFEGVAALARPLLLGENTSADEFAQQHALFWLLAHVAAAGPVAVIVDDAQWLDPASAGFLAYLAERRTELAVAIAVAGRSVGYDDEVLRLIRTRADARCTLVPLRPDQVVSAVTGDGSLDAELVETVAELSAGNPFLVSQLSRALRDGRTIPAGAVADPDVGVVVRDFVSLRSAELSRPARVLLEAAAVAGDGQPWSLARVLAGPEAADDAPRVELLDAQLLLEDDRLVRFPHALVWEAVLDAIPPARRAAGHKVAGLELAGQGRVAEAASHLLLTEPGHDPRVVDALVEQAADERSHGAPGSAVTLLRRALAEPPSPEQATDVVLMLGEALLVVGEVGEAAELLRRTVRGSVDVRRRVSAARTAARAFVFAGDPHRGVELLEQVGRSLPEDDPGLREIRTEVSGIDQTEHSLAAGAALAASATDDGSGFDRRAAEAMSAYDRSIVWTGTAREQVARFEDLLPEAIEVLGVESPLTGMLLNALVVSGGQGWPAARSAIARIDSVARTQGSTVGVAVVASIRSRLLFLEGRLREAEADAELGLELALRGSPLVLPYALSGLVLSRTFQGRLEEAAEVLEGHGYAEREVPQTSPGANLLLARMVLRRSQGRVDEALGDLERMAPFARGRAGWPSPWTPDVVRILLAAGERDRAEHIARDHLSAAEAWDAPLHLAEARLLAASFDRDRAPALLAGACEALGELPAGLTRARVLLALGAARRRANARADAREPLLESLSLAAAAGAEPLVAEVREELAAAGLRPRRVERSGVAALTPSELRICRLAAAGLSNPAIAQELFISPKTVENHLSSAYTKLDIRTRGELRKLELSPSVSDGCG
ncbi:helix-turn-helix transcriptional regulator [Nocardioides panacisoli]|uniref:LuxR family transcriptional regulator n=1 Tax=Nocardioides panacisoli TaxID=627624 RepID=A0ABP7I6R3_9ACTN